MNVKIWKNNNLNKWNNHDYLTTEKIFSMFSLTKGNESLSQAQVSNLYIFGTWWCILWYLKNRLFDQTEFIDWNKI